MSGTETTQAGAAFPPPEPAAGDAADAVPPLELAAGAAGAVSADDAAPAEPAAEPKPLDLDEIAARLLAAKTDLDIPVDQRNAPESETGITGDITVPSHMRSPKVQ